MLDLAMTPEQLFKYIQRIKEKLAKEIVRRNRKLEIINKNASVEQKEDTYT